MSLVRQLVLLLTRTFHTQAVSLVTPHFKVLDLSHYDRLIVENFPSSVWHWFEYDEGYLKVKDDFEESCLTHLNEKKPFVSEKKYTPSQIHHIIQFLRTIVQCYGHRCLSDVTTDYNINDEYVCFYSLEFMGSRKLLSLYFPHCDWWIAGYYLHINVDEIQHFSVWSKSLFFEHTVTPELQVLLYYRFFGVDKDATRCWLLDDFDENVTIFTSEVVTPQLMRLQKNYPNLIRRDDEKFIVSDVTFVYESEKTKFFDKGKKAREKKLSTYLPSSIRNLVEEYIS
jgi:hypothetical protein